MESIDNKNLIEGIRNQDETVLNNLYADCFPTIKRFVVDNSGCEQDAKDVFQDGIIITYRKIKNGTFKLTSSFKSYIYSVCRYIWIKHLFEKKQDVYDQNVYVEYEGIPDVSIDEYEKNEEYKLYQTHFKRLNKDCRKILRLFLKKVLLNDIAKKMGIESVKFVKQKKYKCKEQLIRYIKSDPNFIEK